MTNSNEIKKSAYKKQVEEMIPQELREILLTCDGKGRAFKEKVLEKLIGDQKKALENLEEAADYFLAQPPDDMKDKVFFNQLTTAGDCRRLTKAVLEARKALGE